MSLIGILKHSRIKETRVPHTKKESIKLTKKLFLKYMDKRDGLVLIGILAGAGIAVALMVFVANGIIGNPFL